MQSISTTSEQLYRSSEACDNIIDSRTENFDNTLGNIINIIVSYDMGWSKRGNGKSYDSLNGYGAIIGFLSGKVLDFATRNRKCNLCDKGRAQKDYDCRLNFRGSAKAMEADVGAQLVNDSKILEEIGLRPRVVTGDDDSTLVPAIERTKRHHGKVFKLSDNNHLKRRFRSDLYNIKPQFREMRKPEVIPHLRKCFNFAVAQNKGNSEELAATLRSIPDHVFNQHESCGTWCTRSKDSLCQTILLKDKQLQDALKTIFSKYAANSSKFSVAASSQGNECLNGIMSRVASKNICYSKSEAADVRFAAAVSIKNDGQSFVPLLTKKLTSSPGKHTHSFAAKLDQKRARRAANAKLQSTKSRRNLLRKMRENLRRKTELKEGVQYQPNCGYEQTLEYYGINDNENLAEETSVTADSCKIVYFDLESSGLSRYSDILQIAAKSGNHTFSTYIDPTQQITPEASKLTGLENRNGELFLHNMKVPSIPLKDALQSFLEFLDSSPKLCLLVAHNARFDVMLLLQAMKKTSMITNFKPAIAGFSDTYNIFRKKFPSRKGKGQFQLSTLAKDFLQLSTTDSFHEGLFDVQVLEQLASKCFSTTDLCQYSKSFSSALQGDIQSQNTATIVSSLSSLNRTISRGMIRKIAQAGISFYDLQRVYKDKGSKGLRLFLSEPNVAKKPRVTKVARVLDNIITYFDKGLQ